jgi:hypothetical protein
LIYLLSAHLSSLGLSSSSLPATFLTCEYRTNIVRI